ncbi:hypothetical protein FIE12Z_8540 [Fusarium flagelliforme]|uniref:T cell CD4 receptor C-terminal region domain-containing protein n=1 Tax=Fusarium flagelliforme TaxID=2675880 RepID=A0A395MHD2_9HYPO|nr:hypothetical protein FIE12Z_8540 [Fusarium flagelliforme]
MVRFLSVVLTLIPLILAADFGVVSIESNFEKYGHYCINECLDNYDKDMGEAMGCGYPYRNDCYCATAAASASKADKFMSKCVSSLCSEGDLAGDLISMQSYYASYCMAAGFTQPGATEWYSPAEATEEATSDNSDTGSDAQPSRTANSVVDAISTRMTVITQTAEDGAVRTQVIVEATSTYFVKSDGSPASPKNDNDGSSAIKIGVGVAVLVVALIAAAIFVYWWRRQRRRRKARLSQPTQPLGEVTTGDGPTVVPTSTSTPERRDTPERNPVGASTISSVSSLPRTNELPDTGVQREHGGREVQPFPGLTPSPPIRVAGQHEMTGDGLRPTLEMDGRDARAEMSGEARPSELLGNTNGANAYTPHESVQRWELPDNSRHR